MRAWSALDEHGVRRYLTPMRTRISSKGQLVLPAELRREDGVVAGDEFEVAPTESPRVPLMRRAMSMPATTGMADPRWLIMAGTPSAGRPR